MKANFEKGKLHRSPNKAKPNEGGKEEIFFDYNKKQPAGIKPSRAVMFLYLLIPPYLLAAM